jgi:hypothetical protein
VKILAAAPVIGCPTKSGDATRGCRIAAELANEAKATGDEVILS